MTVTTTDNDGLTGTAALSVTVDNVAPELGDFDDATLEAGGAYTVEGTFADPGADAWIATVDWGDGSSPSQAMLSGHAFSLVHVYATAGTFPVTVTVADDDTETSTVHTVTVTQPPPPPGPDLSQAFTLIDQLVANRKISRDFGNLMITAADAAPLRNLLTQVMTQLNAPPTASAMLQYLALKKHKGCISHQRPRFQAHHHSLRIHRLR